MSTDEGKKAEKNDREASLTRRALIKAGWAIPVILSIGLPVGDVFVHATTGGSRGRAKARKKSGKKYKGWHGEK